MSKPRIFIAIHYMHLGGAEISLIGLLQGNGLDQVLADKDAIRNIFQRGKHALHITDNDEETRIVADMLLTQEGLNSWYESSASAAMKERIRERWYYFKKVEWINIKVAVARFVKGL